MRIPSFRLELKTYQLRSIEKETENNFTDPLYEFDTISKLLLENSVSLAIDPRIILNVVMAQIEKITATAQTARFISEKNFEAITDSLIKWKIVKEWRNVIAS